MGGAIPSVGVAPDESTAYLDAVNHVERRANRNLEASNAAIAAHIGALSDRLATMERTVHKSQAWHPAADTEPRAAQPDSAEDEQKWSTPTTGRSGLPAVPEEGDENGAETGTDPDKKQTAYAEFLGSTEKSLNCVGVHAWSLTDATRQGTTFGASCFALLPSVVILVIQVIVLHAISIEALNPTCVRNEDCPTGTWCSPSWSASGHSAVRGMCDDCLWATRLSEATVDYATLPWRLNSDALSFLSSSDLSAAVTYCTAHKVDQCDFVQDFHDSLTLGTVTVFVFVLMLLLFTIVRDLDKHSETLDVFEHRLWAGQLKFESVAFLVDFAAGVISCTRMFVMPGAVVYAYCALVLTGPATPGFAQPVYFIFSGIVVGVIYHAERLCAMVILDKQAVKRIREAFADESVRAGIRMKDPRDAGMQRLDHRCYAVVLGIASLWIILATNSLMNAIPFFEVPKMWGAGIMTKIPGETNNCTNIATMLSITIALAVFCFTIVWTVANVTASGFKHWSVIVMLAPVNVLIWLTGIWAILLPLVYAPVLNPTP